MNYHHHQIMAALIFPVIALTLVPEAVGLLKGPVTRGPEPTQTAGVREVSATVEGQNVALQCPASEINEDATIVCTRGNQTVFLYRDGRPDPDGQHPSYEGRVKYELKNDSLSLNLMNVSFSDSGTYKCIIKERKGPKEEVITSDICSVNLSVLVSDTQVNMTAGDDATLDCRAHRDGSIEQITWNKTDLESDKYVFFFSGNHSLEDYQHPSFHGRVELKDPQMKEGDASVVLKNVTADDSGLYECVVSTSSEEQRRKRAAPFRHIVHLKVEDSGPKAEGNQEGGSEEGGRKEGGRKEGGRKEGGCKEGGCKDEGNKDEGNKDEGNKEGGNKEGGNPRGRSGLIAAVVVFMICVSAVIVLVVKNNCMKKKSEQPAADEQKHLSESVEDQCESKV